MASLNKINSSPEIHPKVLQVLDYIDTHYSDHPKLSDAGLLVDLVRVTSVGYSSKRRV